MSDLISFDQLNNQIDELRDKTYALGCSVDYYQDALSRAIDVLNNQGSITKSNANEDYSNSSIVIPDITFAIADRVSMIEPMSLPTELIPLQCTSCGAAIDKNTMTCKHCGMSFMLR